MLAVFAINDTKLLAVWTRLPGRPLLHRQEREQARYAEEQIEYCPTNSRSDRETASSRQQPACEGTGDRQNDTEHSPNFRPVVPQVKWDSRRQKDAEQWLDGSMGLGFR